MSSHHIVRENQEPALLIRDFNVLDLESLGQLLEWSPTIITDDRNLDFFLAEGIKVDVIIGEDGGKPLQDSTKSIPGKKGLLVAGLDYLVSNNFNAVNILATEVPDGVEHYLDRINIVVFTKEWRYIYVNQSFEKWKPQGDKIFVDEFVVKSFQGLERVEDNIFTTIEDGFVRLEFDRSDFVIIGEEI